MGINTSPLWFVHLAFTMDSSEEFSIILSDSELDSNSRADVGHPLSVYFVYPFTLLMHRTTSKRSLIYRRSKCYCG